jgi:prepilin-type N-terminal cleavage/methylation domain-containing protein
MFTLKNSTRGFTLIELLVVITIIGILATGGTAVFTTQIQKARDSTRQSEIAQYFSATEQYLSDNSAYPAASVSFT